MTLTIPYLTTTAKTSPFPEVSIVVYRTTVNPTVNTPYYRVSSIDPTTDGNDNGYIANDPTGDTVSFVDEYADTSITNQELDYQNAGELDNIMPEPASILCRGKDRLFLAGLANPNTVQYSKLVYEGDIVMFNDALTLQVDSEGGTITAMAILNESLVVFKQRRIFVVTGEGPNNFGFGAFSQPHLITSDTGCKDQRSVVMMPLGLMFQSEKGIYLLDQKYQLHYIGADVESYNAQVITSAELLADTNQVMFLTSLGRTLVYDYEHNQWSTHTNHEGVDAAIWRNGYVYARSNGRVYQQSATLYTDGGQPYSLKMRTGWLHVAGLQGFQRVRRLHLLGEFHSNHELHCDIEYDYQVSHQYRATFDATTVVPGGTYGSGATYGSDSVYGGTTESVYQFRTRLPRQKCQAVRFTFADKPGTSPGASYEITELALEVGMKRGPFKLGSSKTVTT